MEEELKEEITLYTVKDVERIFHMGHSQAYALVNSQGFPSFRINNRIYVEAEELRKWVGAYKGQKYLV